MTPLSLEIICQQCRREPGECSCAVEVVEVEFVKVTVLEPQEDSR